MIDLTGQKFGKLTVISRAESVGKHCRWVCLCGCGEKLIIFGTSLKSGRSKSCGCSIKLKPEELIGKKFGKLLVLSRSISKKITSKHEKIFYKCLCDCGKITVIPSGNLKSGTWKSCGCLRSYLDRTKPAKNKLFNRYKRNAKERGIKFNLGFDDFIHLTQLSCFYCGKKPSQFYKYYNVTEKFIYNGVDRLNSSGIYEKNNVVPCCKECNYLKWSRDKEEFIEWLKKCLLIHNKLIESKENKIRLDSDTLSSQRSLYWNYKNMCAKKRGYFFDLGLEEFIELTQKNCTYCGTPPNKFFQKIKSQKGFYFNGLDRVDNTQGYKKENVVPCCKACNESKSNLTQEEFFNRIKNCYNHLKNEGLIYS